MLGGFQELSIDFVADNPGLTLFHCHQQLHMDFGFMALFEVCLSGRTSGIFPTTCGLAKIEVAEEMFE